VAHPLTLNISSLRVAVVVVVHLAQAPLQAKAHTLIFIMLAAAAVLAVTEPQLVLPLPQEHLTPLRLGLAAEQLA
jgi:hypothetical protein